MCVMFHAALPVVLAPLLIVSPEAVAQQGAPAPASAQQPTTLAATPVPLDTLADQPALEKLLPPTPALPAIAKGRTPPAAVIGVLSVPDVMLKSTAVQRVQLVLRERRQKLNEELQREQAALQALQQTLVDQRAKLKPVQLRAKEQDLQQRMASARTRLGRRDRVLKEVDQVVSGQVQQTLIGVIRQVSESRGVNVVLHRGGATLNTEAMDLSEQVAEQLNKVLPEVPIPPDGVSPLVAQAQGRSPAPARQP